MIKIITNFIWLFLLFCVTALNATTVSVLQFGLTDTTFSDIGIKEEQERVDSLKPLLIKELVDNFAYKNIVITKELQSGANLANDYIYDHIDVAANLGAKVGSDYIIVGKLHRPSFLFAYIIAKVINVKEQKIISRHTFEAKGKRTQSTQKTIIRLAKTINKSIKDDI